MRGITVQVPDFANAKPVDFKVKPSELLFVELFCGTANLSSAVSTTGLSTYSIDHVVKSSKVSVTKLDISEQEGQRVLFECIHSANLASLHAGPPCGTSSKAREKPLPNHLSYLDIRPLRSLDDLWGDHLPRSATARVRAANILYVVTVIAACLAFLRGTLVSIENPSGSYFWPLAREIAFSLGLIEVWDQLVDCQFHACMWGSSRDKRTTFRASPNLCEPLIATCDNQHTHESWTPSGKDKQVHFPTRDEAAYPMKLCNAHAANLWARLLELGVKAEPCNLREQTAINARDLRQFTSKRVPPLMGEFWFIGSPDTLRLFPDRCKQLKGTFLIGKEGIWVQQPTSQDQANKLEAAKAGLPETCTVKSDNPTDMSVGVYRSPEQAIQAALQIKHPLQFATPIPDLLAKTVVEVLNMGPQAVINLRRENLSWILDVRRKLAGEERNVHASLHVDVAACLKGKQTCLWEKLLSDTAFPDLQLIEDVRSGIEVIGPAEWSPVFKRGYCPPQMTPEQWQAQAIWRRKAAISTCKPSGDPAVDDALWTQSLEERDEGWIKGPFLDEAQVSAELGVEDWVCARRFALRQPNKIRLIDDAKASGINRAFSTFSKLQLMDADTLISLVLLIIRCTFLGSETQVLLSNGTALECRPHASWGRDLHLVGRTLDLSSAYKQLAMKPATPQVRPLVAWSPEHGRPVFFIATSLMFGTTASVYAFNRASLSLWHLSLSLGKTWNTCYFDDYPGVEFTQTSKTSRSFLEGLLQALGWKFADSGKKALDYQPVFDALGITLDVSAAHKGKIVVSNKKARVKDLMGEVDGILAAGKISPRQASALHGRLNYAQGQLFGCALKPAMVYLSKWATESCEDTSVLATVMVFLTAALSKSPPRSLSVHDTRAPAILFTDGAYEPDAAPPWQGRALCSSTLGKGREWWQL